MKRIGVALGLLLVTIVAIRVVADGPLTAFPNLRGRTDASGYLLTTGGGYTAPDGPLTAMANLRVRVDANGYLLTTTSTSANNLFYAADGSAILPSYTFSGNTAIGMWRSTGALGLSGSGIGFYPFGNTSQGWLMNTSGVFTNVVPLTNATLPASTNGSMVYCTDCAPTTPATCPATKASCVCTGSGSGAWAMRINSVWDCALFQ